MPKRGIWQQTRKMKSVTAVHSTFSLNWICVEGGRGWGWEDGVGREQGQWVGCKARPVTRQESAWSSKRDRHRVTAGGHLWSSYMTVLSGCDCGFTSQEQDRN